MGYRVVEEPITRTELYYSDEAFFTGTAAEVTPITRLDHRKIGEGKVGQVTRKIKEKYEAVVRAKEEKYKKWLTPVYP